MKGRIRTAVVYGLTVMAVLYTAHWGSRAVTVLAENPAWEKRRCVVLDAGHGGVDGGAVSCTGRPESEYNLQISLRLRDMLHLLGIDTRMIRTEDVSVYTNGETIAQKKVSDLKERVRIVNETEDALLVSIHQNQFSDSRYSGAQVFYAGTSGSEALAREIQEAYDTHLKPGNNRKIRKISGIYLMDHIQCTGVLIECGFLSNPQEEAKLHSEEYQKRLSSVIAVAIRQNLSNT